MRIEVGRLVAVVAEIFRRAGCSPEEAREVANGLVDADLVGHERDGVVRVPGQAAALITGETRAGRRVRVVGEVGSAAILDGDGGLGAPVTRQAVEFGTRWTAGLGCAVVALRRCEYLGRMGRWAELAAERGLVSAHFATGGVDGRDDATAPRSFGIPMPDRAPLIYDTGAPSAEGPSVTRGRKSSSIAVPPAPDEGEALASMLSTLAWSLAAPALAGHDEERAEPGMLSLYMLPQLFRSTSTLADAVEAVLGCARTAAADGPVLLPGDRERFTRADRLAHGIPLSDEVWNAIEQEVLRLGLHPWSYLLV